MTNEHSGHLAEERIQAFLDDRLPAEERAAVREHLDRCVPCRTEYEAWQSVFARLEEVPELSPSPGFAERVLDRLPERKPVGERIREWVRGLLPDRRPLRGHLEPELVLAYLDRALPGRRRIRVVTHLEGCAACREDVGEWRRVFQELEELERYAPSEGFAETVLSRVRVSAEAPARAAPDLAERIAGWAERLRPRTRKGWALAGGAAAAPAVAMAAGVLALFSHPLLTPASLGTFLWWQISGAARTLLGTGVQSVMESPLLFQVWGAVQALAESPTLVGAGALAFSAMTVGAVWVLYRNLISTPTVERGYANVSS